MPLNRTDHNQTFDETGKVLSDVTVDTNDVDGVIKAIIPKIQAALTANLNYLNIANPTAAQNAAQVAFLTKEMNALIRLIASGRAVNLPDLLDVNGL